MQPFFRTHELDSKTLKEMRSYTYVGLKPLGAIHSGPPPKIGIFRPALPRLSGFNNRISLEITIGVQFSKIPPSPGKPGVLNGWPLKKFLSGLEKKIFLFLIKPYIHLADFG